MVVLRVVIDSNRLQSDELRSFLTVDAENFAVLTDYAWMEAYKGNSIVSIQKPMAILKDFPNQVIVLKGTKAVSALDPSAPGIAKRMYWSGGGREFHDTVAGLEQAQAGHPNALRQIVDYGKSADRQMDRILTDIANMPAAFLDMMGAFLSKDEIAAVRVGKPYSEAMVYKFFDMSDYMALRFYKAHPQKPRRPTRRARYDAFMYRFSLACLLYFLDWVREGSQLNKSAAKLRNDAVDINFATYGTYFNGLMSDDRRVRDLHLQLRVVLEKVGARMPEEYFGELIAQLEAAN